MRGFLKNLAKWFRGERIEIRGSLTFRHGGKRGFSEIRREEEKDLKDGKDVKDGGKNSRARARARVTCTVLAVLVLSGCARTNTEIVEVDWESGVSTRMTIDSWSVGGRILNRAARTEYAGDGWTMTAGDGAQEVGADPEVVRAAVQGAVQAMRFIP